MKERETKARLRSMAIVAEALASATNELECTHHTNASKRSELLTECVALVATVQNSLAYLAHGEEPAGECTGCLNLQAKFEVAAMAIERQPSIDQIEANAIERAAAIVRKVARNEPL